MATFLELCRDVALESGTLSGGANIQSVTAPGNTRAQSIVSWVRKAWLAIQMESRDWRFMRRTFDATVYQGQARYSGTALAIEGFGDWATDRPWFRPFTMLDPAIGADDERDLRQIDYDEWRARYDRGAQQQGRPLAYAISPAGELCFGPVPDRTYSLRGECRAAAQKLIANDDVPQMPEEYHPAIVWEALRRMASADEVPVAVNVAAIELQSARHNLVRDQLPPIAFAPRFR